VTSRYRFNLFNSAEKRAFEERLRSVILKLEREPSWDLTSLLKSAGVDAASLGNAPLSGVDLSNCDLAMLQDRALDLRGCNFGHQAPCSGSWLGREEFERAYHPERFDREYVSVVSVGNAVFAIKEDRLLRVLPETNKCEELSVESAPFTDLVGLQNYAVAITQAGQLSAWGKDGQCIRKSFNCIPANAFAELKFNHLRPKLTRLDSGVLGPDHADDSSGSAASALSDYCIISFNSDHPFDDHHLIWGVHKAQNPKSVRSSKSFVLGGRAGSGRTRVRFHDGQYGVIVFDLSRAWLVSLTADHVENLHDLEHYHFDSETDEQRLNRYRAFLRDWRPPIGASGLSENSLIDAYKKARGRGDGKVNESFLKKHWYGREEPGEERFDDSDETFDQLSLRDGKVLRSHRSDLSILDHRASQVETTYIRLLNNDRYYDLERVDNNHLVVNHGKGRISLWTLDLEFVAGIWTTGQFVAVDGVLVKERKLTAFIGDQVGQYALPRL
jgi:hypothetical protein